jgi:hypothetical protein
MSSERGVNCEDSILDYSRVSCCDYTDGAISMIEEPPVAVWLNCVKSRRSACASPRNRYGYAIGEVASSLPVGDNLLETLDLTTFSALHHPMG